MQNPQEVAAKRSSFLPQQKPARKPDAEIDSRYERASPPSLGGRDTLPLSIFGRGLIPGDSSGVRGSIKEEVGEAHIPLCIVDVDGKE